MRGAWPTAILIFALLFAFSAAGADPVHDVVSIHEVGPVSADGVPGLLEGRELMDRLSSIRDELRSGVPEVARGGISALLLRIERLVAGRGIPLPNFYRAEGDLWIPVQAAKVQVVLDAPNLLPRPRPGGEGGVVENLTTRATRIAWLPLARTRDLLEDALRDVAPRSEVGGGPPLQRIEEVLSAVVYTMRFEQQPLLEAYYALERGLGAGRPWPAEVRTALREAARALSRLHVDDLASQLQAVADEVDPDDASLVDTARALRDRIAQQATAGQSASDGAAAGGQPAPPVRAVGRARNRPAGAEARSPEEDGMR
jgi:hypothetical protein